MKPKCTCSVKQTATETIVSGNLTCPVHKPKDPFVPQDKQSTSWERDFDQIFGDSLWQEHKSANPYPGELPQYHAAGEKVKSFIHKLLASPPCSCIFNLKGRIVGLCLTHTKREIEVGRKSQRELLETIELLIDSVSNEKYKAGPLVEVLGNKNVSIEGIFLSIPLIIVWSVLSYPYIGNFNLIGSVLIAAGCWYLFEEV